MPGAIIATSAAQERAHLYHDRLTPRSFLYSALIAQAGFLFGYDLGITGGVTGMPQVCLSLPTLHASCLEQYHSFEGCSMHQRFLSLWKVGIQVIL